jgi:NAD(P)-dependent dehydrogenase (short-subunit alcohol dehydrogenase family)
MSSRHCVLTTGAPSGIGAVFAGDFAGRGFYDRFLADARAERNGGCRERARIVHELHVTSFQMFLGACLLNQAVDQTPDPSSSKRAFSQALVGQGGIADLHLPPRDR